MKLTLQFTPTARRQFLDALTYIHADRPLAARQFKDRAMVALARLRQHPESGRRIPEFPDLPYREVIVPPYRFFYREKAKVIWIVAAWHDAQLPQDPEVLDQ